MTPLSLPPPDALDEPGRTLEEVQAFALDLEHLAEHTRRRIRELSSAPSTRDRVRELAEQKLSDSEIAAQLGIRRDYVVRLRTLEGVPAAKPRGEDRTPWRQITTDLLARGASVKEIAEATKVNERTAANRCSILRKEAGAPKRKAKG